MAYFKKCKTLLSLIFRTNTERFISAYFLALKKEFEYSSNKNNQTIAIQSSQDLYYYIVFGLVSVVASKLFNTKTHQIVFHSLMIGESKSFTSYAKSKLLNFLINKKWERLNNSFSIDVAYSSTGFTRPIHDLHLVYKAYLIWRKIKKDDDILSLTIDGIFVGDLINDTYIRYKPVPILNIKDKYLVLIIWQALREINRSTAYFTKTKPSLFLCAYSVYIQHGISVRVALSLGVKVLSFGNYQEFCKELSLKDWYHTKDPTKYLKKYLTINKKTKINLLDAEISLEKRFKGEIDRASAYMRHSAYEQSEHLDIDVSDGVVVFFHDFYDSPHIYPNMIFRNFFEWATYTIDTLTKNKIKFFVKPHPNQIDINDSILESLQSTYPDLVILNPKITNLQLVNAGIKTAITVYGNVAHEIAYLGVPSIAASNNPHMSFNFCKTAKSIQEYKQLLQNVSKMKYDKIALRKEAVIFYYMHNLNYHPEMIKLINLASDLRNILGSSKLDLSYLLETINRIKDNKSFINLCRKYLSS